MATNLYSTVESHIVRTKKSKKISASLASGTYSVLRIPRYTLVKDIWLFVKTVFDGITPATLTIGFAGNGETEDGDGFMDAASALLTSTGLKRATSDSQPWSEGKWFGDAAGSIEVVFTLNDSTAGEAYIFADTAYIQ